MTGVKAIFPPPIGTEAREIPILARDVISKAETSIRVVHSCNILIQVE
jgi:hypothetical protein